MLIAFHKPYGVLSQFTASGSPHLTLSQFGFPPGVYPIGRLDADSEGLLLLSDEPSLNRKLLHPDMQHPRLYWAQVERVPTPEKLRLLNAGVKVHQRRTQPAEAWLIQPQPTVPERIPPIRYRKTVPTTWLGLILIEGKNRQVRHMTAAIGHPTLRLIRQQIGCLGLMDLAPGQWRLLGAQERAMVFQHRAS
jgi:23S rRNA pseudouridine2457 synthase